MANEKLMMGRRSFIGGSIAAAALTALAGCGKKGGSASGDKSGGNKGGTLKFYINEPVAIDPYNTQGKFVIPFVYSSVRITFGL